MEAGLPFLSPCGVLEGGFRGEGRGDTANTLRLKLGTCHDGLNSCTRAHWPGNCFAHRMVPKSPITEHAEEERSTVITAVASVHTAESYETQSYQSEPTAAVSGGASVLQPAVIVIFGATGDLTARKLMPALFALDRGGYLPARQPLWALAAAQRPTSNSRPTFGKRWRNSVPRPPRTAQA